MPTPKKGPRLGGSPAHQRLILSNLAIQLIEHRAITTTEAKAKVLQPYVEKLVTKAKRGDLHARRTVARKIPNRDAVYELFDVITPALDPERAGGYTRITRVGTRKGDNAPLARIEFVTERVEKKAVVAAAEKTAERAASTPAAEAAEEETEAVEVVEESEDAAEAAFERAEDALETGDLATANEAEEVAAEAGEAEDAAVEEADEAEEEESEAQKGSGADTAK